MRVRVLRHVDYRRMRWKNGGGWTTELAAFPESGADAAAPFDWRVSIAEIESDGAFSPFPGCDRHIALLEGVGMELRFDDAETLRLDQRLRFVSIPTSPPSWKISSTKRWKKIAPCATSTPQRWRAT